MPVTSRHSRFSTLKILATVKQSQFISSKNESFSTLKILATVKLTDGEGIFDVVLVPLRF